MESLFNTVAKAIAENQKARSNTYVANASGELLRVYYSVDRMRLDQIVADDSETKVVFKPDSRIRYMHIPVGDSANISGEGALYLSVFVEGGSSDECLKTLSDNFHIPSDRSVIVTKNHSLKFQKYAANIWVDEDGYDHRP